jgi:AMMECR1 domain-containing protein
MSMPRTIAARWLARWIVVACVAAAARATAADVDALAPYRQLARTPQAARVLTYTRGAIDRVLAGGDAAADSAAGAAPDSSGAPPDSLDWPGTPCGVIVSLARGATTRACVGSLTPLGGSLAGTLERLASEIVASDPRHPPLRRDELAGLRVLVAFTSTPIPVRDPMQVSPAREGLLVSTTKGTVAYLPGVARTISWALREARQAGVLDRVSEASFQRFTAVILQEPSRTTSQETPNASP